MWIAALVSTDENCVVKVGRLRAMTNGRSGHGGVGSWPRRRPCFPYVRACSITVSVAAIERSP